jgi:aspartate kinase
MSIIIKKYGGACFQSMDGYRRIAHALASASGRQAVVVSARKGATDHLLRQAQALGGAAGTPHCDQLLATGELQSVMLLLVALSACGVRAELVPADEVFMTDGVAGDAVITAVHTEKIVAALGRGAIPLLPGFYGAGTTSRVVTFGRGGSDYSAVALGVALGASQVELFKAEVDGIFDKDPNVDPSARQFAALSHEEALAIARGGGKVLQEKSAWLALKWGVPLVVRPAFKQSPGTKIGFSPAPVGARVAPTVSIV